MSKTSTSLVPATAETGSPEDAAPLRHRAPEWIGRRPYLSTSKAPDEGSGCWRWESDRCDVQRLLMEAGNSLAGGKEDAAFVAFGQAFSAHLQQPERVHLGFSATMPPFFCSPSRPSSARGIGQRGFHSLGRFCQLRDCAPAVEGSCAVWRQAADKPPRWHGEVGLRARTLCSGWFVSRPCTPRFCAAAEPAAPPDGGAWKPASFALSASDSRCELRCRPEHGVSIESERGRT